MTKDELELENADLRAALLRIKDIAESAMRGEAEEWGDDEHDEDCACADCEDKD